jgi:hypothetical protein
MAAVGSSFGNNTPVVVNLDVLVDANGTINVFGQAPPSVSNVVVANVTLPVNALYDVSGTSNSGVTNSLFEFWEPSDAIGTKAATKGTGARDYSKMTKKFVRDLQAIFEGSFDCSGASPFNAGAYTGNANYTTQADFGRLALSAYSHYLFGHVAATAAITNDQAFMDSMLSKSGGAYKYAAASDVAGNVNGSEWVAPTIGTSSDADVARLLAGAVLTKNDAAILSIVEQVIGQDASRAMDQDNNALAPDVRQPLKFIAGDVIYMNVRLTTPNVTLSNASQQVAAATLQGKYTTQENYTIKITLEDKAGFSYAA